MKDKMWYRIISKNEIVILAITVVFSLLIGVINPAFWGIGTITGMARASLLMFIFALCEMMVMISGGIDVSFPAIATMSMYGTTIFMMKYGIDNILFAYVFAAAVGILLGLVNAVLVGGFRIPALIATLGTSSLINGTMLAVLGSREITMIPECMENLHKVNLFSVTARDGSIASMPVLIMIPVVLCVVFWLILRYTMLGRAVYAIGGDLVSAERVGFPVVKVQFFIYMFTGMIAGIGGVTYTVLMRSSNATNLMGSEMLVIAAVVIGGTKITGGEGTVTGTVLGVILINLISNNLIILGISTYWQTFVIGIIIVIGACFTSLKAKKASLEMKI